MGFDDLTHSELESVFSDAGVHTVRRLDGTQVPKHNGLYIEMKEIRVEAKDASRESLIALLRSALQRHVRNHANVGNCALTYGARFFDSDSGTLLMLTVGLTVSNLVLPKVNVLTQ